MKNSKALSVTMVIVVGVSAMLTGCASTGVQRRPPDRERPITERFDPDDARRTVEAMVDSMLSFGPVIELTQQRRPVVDLQPLQNRTMEHIDTRALTTSIRTRLLRTGLFRFTDRTTRAMDIEEMNVQRESGLFDPDQAVAPGQQSAPELYIYGEISQQRTVAGRVIDQYYKINLSLQDLRSGELIWTDEQEIRKERRRPIF